MCNLLKRFQEIYAREIRKYGTSTLSLKFPTFLKILSVIVQSVELLKKILVALFWGGDFTGSLT